MRLSAIDRKILNCIQEDIPLHPEPFKLLSRRLKITEDFLLEKVRLLKKKGIIRRFSAGLDHRKLGFKSSLIALRLPLERIESAAKEIVSYPEVTHCYLREGDYNLWVVFICPGKKSLTHFMNKLMRRNGKKNILNLPTKRQFKLKTTLKF